MAAKGLNRLFFKEDIKILKNSELHRKILPKKRASSIQKNMAERQWQTVSSGKNIGQNKKN